jgi:hypothetical protein
MERAASEEKSGAGLEAVSEVVAGRLDADRVAENGKAAVAAALREFPPWLLRCLNGQYGDSQATDGICARHASV